MTMRCEHSPSTAALFGEMERLRCRKGVHLIDGRLKKGGCFAPMTREVVRDCARTSAGLLDHNTVLFEMLGLH